MEVGQEAKRQKSNAFGGKPSNVSDSKKVEIVGVRKAFGLAKSAAEVVALNAVDLTIADGEFFTLLGPSGCGKTTLLRLIAGFEVPTSGTIYLDGNAVNDLPAHKRPVNTVFQSYALFPHLTVAKNIAFSLEMLGVPDKEIRSTVAKMLDLVRLEGAGERWPSQLSGGQQQRIALARALASKPSLLLLDEPLSALDLRLRREMQGELKRIQYDTGTTFIYVTHDQEEALAMSDRIAVMNAGKIHQVGSPRQIYDEPADLVVARFIGDINLVDAELTSQREQTARITLPNGTVTEARCSVPVHPGAGVMLSFRPEKTQICQAESGLFKARVLERTYVGTQTVVRLQSEFDGHLMAFQRSDPSTSDASVGDMVGIDLLPGAAYILSK